MSSESDAGSLRSTPSPRPPASSFGSVSVRRKTSAWMARSAAAPSPRIRSGTHGRSVGIVTMIGVPSPLCCPSAAARDASKRAAMKMGLRAA